tara:strand:+ start:1402 stop:1812 length:411 start_codon:yes stop_codon:yes gene_type:complete
MNKNFNIKDSVIILFIIAIFFSVIAVFYTEIIKNNKIATSKKNFYLVREEILLNAENCFNKSNSWFFGGSCTKSPSLEDLMKYIISKHEIINPYDNSKGIMENPGSVLIKIEDKRFIISIDYDANGGIDIKENIIY